MSIDENENVILEKLKMGYSIAQISDELKVSKSYVSKVKFKHEEELQKHKPISVSIRCKPLYARPKDDIKDVPFTVEQLIAIIVKYHESLGGKGSVPFRQSLRLMEKMDKEIDPDRAKFYRKQLLRLFKSRNIPYEQETNIKMDSGTADKFKQLTKHILQT